MRWQLVFLVLILIVPVFALRIENTGIPAFDFSLYSDVIVYENDEGISFYNIKTKESEFIANGKNPSIYGFIIAFDSVESAVNKDINADGDFDDSVIRYFDLKKKKLFDIDIIGSRPSVYGSKIVFEVSEKEIGLDLNDDKDSGDHVIHVFDIETKKVDNTKIVGMNVFAGLNVAAFETDEKEYGNDLSGDSKLNDKVIRLILLDDLSVINTALPGEEPSIYKDKLLVFTANEAVVKKDVNEDGDFNDLFPVILTLPDLNKIETSLTGAFPSAFKDVVVFVEDNKLMGYSKVTDSWFLNDLYCSHPVLFENFAVILTHEKLEGDLNEDGGTKDSVLRVVFFEDIDKDSVSDLIDNCPDLANPDQKDIDFDGIGDACDEDVPEEAETVAESEIEADSEADDEVKLALPQEKEEKSKGSFLKTLFFIVLLLSFVIFMVKWLPGYLEKKRKGFGF